MIKQITILFILLGVLFSCKNEKPNNFKRSFYQSFKIIKEKYIKTHELNWTEIEKNVLDSIPNFGNNLEVYNGIKYVLNQIGDNHSFFLPPNKTSNPLLNDSLHIPDIKYRILESNIGYLKIPGFIANDSLSSIYSFKIRKTLKKIDKHTGLQGLVIDLRDNVGGKMGEISLGLQPLYKNETIGFSLDNKAEYIEHKLKNNVYYYGKNIVNKINLNDSLNNYKLSNMDIPIAILVNGKTASMGEATAQSFKFQKNTLIFGTKTRGLTTDLQVFEYVSGARIGITTAFMCDENKNIIIKEIIPDIECKPEKSLELAIEWIKKAI